LNLSNRSITTILPEAIFGLEVIQDGCPRRQKNLADDVHHDITTPIVSTCNISSLDGKTLKDKLNMSSTIIKISL
jgi:hypothetical protein